MFLVQRFFAVATNPASDPGGMTRSPLMAWVYGQTFTGIVLGTPETLAFKDCDAWAETPGVEPEHRAFVGDVPELVQRMVHADQWLSDALDFEPGHRNGSRCAILSDLYSRQCDFEHLRVLLSIHLFGDMEGNLCDEARPDRIHRVDLALTAWKESRPFPLRHPGPPSAILGRPFLR